MQVTNEFNLKLIRFPADWDKLGRKAGYIRNEKMALYAKEDNGVLIAFWDKVSKGTKSMIDLANKKGGSNMSKGKCFYCEKELKENEKCNCEKSKERWGYITSNAVKSDKGYICPCGNNNFKTIFHIDYKDSYSSTYECNKCGNYIGVCFQRVENWW